MAQYTTNYNLTKIDLTDAPPDITVLNSNWDTIDEMLKTIAEGPQDFDYYMNLYGYTYTQSDSEENGTTTIAVTLDSSSPVTGTLTAVISESGGNDTVIDVTTVLGGVTTKYKHTLNDEGGEGGIYNG